MRCVSFLALAETSFGKLLLSHHSQKKSFCFNIANSFFSIFSFEVYFSIIISQDNTIYKFSSISHSKKTKSQGFNFFD